MEKPFIVEIEILSDGWDYHKGETVHSIVYSNNSNNAALKFERLNGSEFPNFRFNIIHCDDYLFNPSLELLK